MSSYRLLKDRFDYKAGTIVYDYKGYDYGGSSDDERYTGIEHITITSDNEGTKGFFTVPINDLEKL